MRLETCFLHSPNSKWEKVVWPRQYIFHSFFKAGTQYISISLSHNMISKNIHFKNTHFPVKPLKLKIHYPKCERKISNPVISETGTNKFWLILWVNTPPFRLRAALTL